MTRFHCPFFRSKPNYNKYESDMVNHKLDSNSAAIIAEVENVLIFEVPGSSLALFQDRTDLKKTPVDENVSQVVIGKLRMWQAVLDELDNRISQLMKIIQAERTTPSSQF